MRTSLEALRANGEHHIIDLKKDRSSWDLSFVTKSIKTEPIDGVVQMVMPDPDVTPCRLRFGVSEQLRQRRLHHAFVVQIGREAWRSAWDVSGVSSTSYAACFR